MWICLTSRHPPSCVCAALLLLPLTRFSIPVRTTFTRPLCMWCEETERTHTIDGLERFEGHCGDIGRYGALAKQIPESR